MKTFKLILWNVLATLIMLSIIMLFIYSILIPNITLKQTFIKFWPIVFLIVFPQLLYMFNVYNKGDWIVKKCGFPYPEGYCTYNPKTRTLLDTGLTHEEAKEICKELNKNKK